MDKKRVTVKMKEPNPLFESWLTEWRDAERSKDNKRQHCYSMALQSLKKYPLPLKSGKECLILKGFGKKLCQMLDDKLKTHKPGERNERKATTSKADDKKSCDKKVSANLTKRNKQEYAPAYRSGGYAILLTLYEDSLEDNSKGFMFKSEIIPLAQKFCDKSFTKSDTGSFYTAWSSMRTLVAKGFVTKSSNPAKFSISEAGASVALKLYKSLKGNDSLPQKSPGNFVGDNDGVDKENRNCFTSNDEEVCIDLDSSSDEGNFEENCASIPNDMPGTFKSTCEDKFSSKYEDNFSSEYEDNFSSKYEDNFNSKLEDKFSSSSKHEDKLGSKYEDKLSSKYKDNFSSEYEDKFSSSPKYEDKFGEDKVSSGHTYEDKFSSMCEDRFSSEYEDNLSSSPKYEVKLSSKYGNKFSSKNEDKFSSRYEDQFRSNYEDKIRSKYDYKLSSKYEDKLSSCEDKNEDKLSSNYENKLSSNYEDKLSSKYGDKLSSKYEDKVSSSEDKTSLSYEDKYAASTSEILTTLIPSNNKKQTGLKFSQASSKKSFGRNPSASSISSLTDEVTKPKRGRQKKFEKNPSCASISSETSNANQEEMFVMAPSTFDIVLLVDKQETAGANVVYDEFIAELQSRNIKFEARHLKVGDYTWICRSRALNKELVLPYILERKRMDDLGQSIKDGRFYEQKFRLKQSGVQNLIYLVENFEDNKHCGLPLTSLFQAATNTLVQDGFSVKFTDGLRGTVEYLTCMTKILIKMFKDKTLMSCIKQDLPNLDLSDDLLALMTFKEFNQSASKTKNLKVQEMFIKQLLQLRGVSVEKALAIVEVYPTPRSLKEAYDSCSVKDGENLLSAIPFGKLRKNVGSIISKTIYQLYTFKQY